MAASLVCGGEVLTCGTTSFTEVLAVLPAACVSDCPNTGTRDVSSSAARAIRSPACRSFQGCNKGQQMLTITDAHVHTHTHTHTHSGDPGVYEPG